jgi:hypothetical protein
MCIPPVHDGSESIIEKIKSAVKENVSYCKIKQNKPWFDKSAQ